MLLLRLVLHRLAAFTPSVPIADSDTDDDNDGAFFYNEAHDAESSDDDSNDATPHNRRSAHTSKPTSHRSSMSHPPHPATTTSAARHSLITAVPVLPAIPVQRPTCCICTSVELIDPWLSACSHLCCGECWVAWLMEQSESGDMTGGTCPECGQPIDLEGLKRVVLCDRCARLCVSGAGQHWTHAPCRHTCCLQCWKGQLASSHTVSSGCFVSVGRLQHTFVSTAHCEAAAFVCVPAVCQCAVCNAGVDAALCPVELTRP